MRCGCRKYQQLVRKFLGQADQICQYKVGVTDVFAQAAISQGRGKEQGGRMRIAHNNASHAKATAIAYGAYPRFEIGSQYNGDQCISKGIIHGQILRFDKGMQ